MVASFFNNFLLIALFCLTQAQSSHLKGLSTNCPPPNLIKPCTCEKPWYSKDVYLICNGILIQDVLLQVLERSSDYAYSIFELRHSSIMYLPISALQIKALTRIIISSTSMISIFDRTPSKNNVLDKIELENVRLMRGMRLEQFHTLQKLREVKVRNVPIRFIGKKFADNMPRSIEILAFFDSNIAKLDQNVLAKFKELKDVTFQGGRLKKLTRSMFPSPAKLTDLDFSRNQISSLPDDIFTQMPYLKSITFDNNMLTLIPEDVYRDVLPQLDYLYLYGNPLVCGCYLRWIVEADKGSVYLSGKCEEPKSMEGRDLKSLVSQDFIRC